MDPKNNAASRKAPSQSAKSKSGAKSPTTDNDQTKKPDEKYRGELVVVTGPSYGRWRGGRKFTTTPTKIQPSELSEEQFKGLMDDPLLSVVPGHTDEDLTMGDE